MKTRAFGVIILSGMILFGAFTNCEQSVDFVSQSALKTPLEVKKACADRAHQSRTVSINFPKPNVTCAWGEGGNLAPRDEYFQARIEQTANIDIPSGATICNMDFSFPTQQYLYDDHFLMVLNGKVLASSYNFDGILSASNGLLNYAWSPIAGIFWDQNNREGVFCPTVTGTDGISHSSSCAWPDTDIAGQISMEFPEEVMYAAMANDLTRTHHELKFVSIGDNDNLDCEHSDIRFSVTVDYVQ